MTEFISFQKISHGSVPKMLDRSNSMNPSYQISITDENFLMCFNDEIKQPTELIILIWPHNKGNDLLMGSCHAKIDVNTALIPSC